MSKKSLKILFLFVFALVISSIAGLTSYSQMDPCLKIKMGKSTEFDKIACFKNKIKSYKSKVDSDKKRLQAYLLDTSKTILKESQDAFSSFKAKACDLRSASKVSLLECEHIVEKDRQVEIDFVLEAIRQRDQGSGYCPSDRVPGAIKSLKDFAASKNLESILLAYTKYRTATCQLMVREGCSKDKRDQAMQACLESQANDFRDKLEKWFN